MTEPRKLYAPRVAPNGHLDALLPHFGHLGSGTLNISDDMQFLLLCYTNRSGSNYLAELLASNGRIRRAGENLNAETVLNHSRKRDFKTFYDYFNFLVRHTQLNNFVSLKVAPAHIELLAVSGILDQIIERCKFVVIERNDKLGQAISHSIAFHTGKFMSTMPDKANIPPPVFDAEELTTIIENIAEAYKQFNLFFARNGIVPVHVAYEHLVSRPGPIVRYIGQEIGLPDLSVDPKNITLEKQASKLNQEWRRLYLEAV
jgi:LPS sulfotransferase NodH